MISKLCNGDKRITLEISYLRIALFVDLCDWYIVLRLATMQLAKRFTSETSYLRIALFVLGIAIGLAVAYRRG
jgi:hypothetical protein